MTSSVPAIATIDFGASFTDEALLAVTGLTDMTTTAHIECWMQSDDTTADNNAVAHDALSFLLKNIQPLARVAGTGFTARVRLADGLAKGTFKFHYVYVV